MNFKTTIGLIVVLVVVGAIWLLTPAREAREGVTNEVAPPSEEQLVFDPAPAFADITRVELARADAPDLAFERIPEDERTMPQDDWRIVAPVTGLAESFRVRSLVTSLTQLRARASFAPGDEGAPSPADAGLDPPRAVLTLHAGDGAQYTLEIGKKSVLSNDTYVRRTGDDAILVAQRDLAQQLQADVAEYRSKRLINVRVDDVTAIQVAGPERTVDLTIAGDDWVLDEPVKAYAQRSAARGLVTQLNGVRAVEFADDAAADRSHLGFEAPYLMMRVTTETEREVPAAESPAATQPAEPETEIVTETHTLRVGNFADLKRTQRYAQADDDGGVVIVNDADVSNLIPNLDELRDPQVTRIQAADVAALTITAGDDTAELTKTDGQWRGTGDLAMLDVAAVTQLLDAIEDLTAISFIDDPGPPAEYGLAAPRTVLTIDADGLVAPLTLRIGSTTASGRNAYVQRAGSDTVIVTRAAQADRLAVTPLNLRAREIFDFDEALLGRISIVGGPIAYELERVDGDWQFVMPAEAPLDRGAVRTLARDLSRLRASRVVARDAQGYGLDQPVVMITFEREAAPPPTTQDADVAPPPEPLRHTVTVGWFDEQAYARVDDGAYVYALDKTIYDVLTAEMIEPKLLDFPAGEIAALTIAATGGTLELSRNEDGDWIYTPDPFVKLDQTKVQELMRAVAGMRAERYFAYGDADLAVFGLDAPLATVTMTRKSGGEIVMAMTQTEPNTLPRLATLAAPRRVFRLRQATVEQLLRGLEEYLAAEGESAPPMPNPRQIRQ
jgi:hypothetical protein